MKKLKKGDYTPNLTEEQFNELLDIENYNGFQIRYNEGNGIMFDGKELLHDHKMWGLKNKLTFDEFKQRAINTFKQAVMKKYHISWLIGKDEQGLDLSTGITVEAESMLEALAAWSMAHPEIVEPLYIAVK